MNFYDVKEDWSDVKKRWAAWWEFELYDRPLLIARAPKNDPDIPDRLIGFPDKDVSAVEKYTDPAYLISKTEYEFYSTFYGGESIPTLQHGWSVGHAITYGCEPHFTYDTVWADTLPIIEGEEYPNIHFDENNRWWRMFLDNTEKIARASRKRYFVMPMVGNHAGDNLLICRGSVALMQDLAENPEWVKANVKYISDKLQQQIAAMEKLTPLTGLGGSVSYIDTWSPKTTLGVDCDLSCMISPGQFKDIFLPPLIDTMQNVDHCVYHLDGAVALHQLDILLATNEINAFQWLPGAGREEIMQWIPLLQKMQAHRKSLYVYTSPEFVIPLIKELRSEGLCIQVWPDTEDDARRLIDSVNSLYT